MRHWLMRLGACFAVALLAGAPACSSHSTLHVPAPASAGAPAGGQASAGNNGGSMSGGASSGGSANAGAPAAAMDSSVSGLPLPSSSDVPEPAGAPGNLKVLNWAGFKAAVSYTFDDSLSSQIQHYAELQATGVRMTFYLVSNNNGSSSTWTQAAADGHEIGNHTAHHCHDDGTGCAWGSYAGSLSAEHDLCTDHITQTFGVTNVWTTAAPYGDAGYATSARARFLLNRGVGGGQVAANDATDPFSLPCHVAAQGELASGFNSVIDSARAAGKWQLILIHSLGGDGGYNPVSIGDVVSSVNHAKAAGDIWVDSVVNVGAYWRAQKLLAGASITSSGSDTTWTWTLPDHFPPGKYLRVTVDGGTLKQAGSVLAWDPHGYYEVALDAGSLTLSP